MQDREFEEQVHKKMEAFNLPPSDAVWEEVERRLHEKEKRRRWFIWLPTFLLGIGAGVYFLMYNPETGPGSISKTRNTQTVQHPPANAATGTPLNQTVSKDLPESTPGQSAASSIHNHLNRNSTPPFNATTPIVTRGGKRIERNGNGNDITRITHPVTTEQETRTPGAILQPDAAVTSMINDEPNFTDALAIREPVAAEVTDPNLLQRTISVAAQPLVAGQAFSAPPVKLAAENKWSSGVNLSGGRSSINYGRLTTLFGNAMVADFASQNAISNGGVAHTASPLTAGTALSGGMFVSRKVTRRITLSVGLNAYYYATHHRVGTKIDNSFSFSSPSVGGGPPLQSGRIMPERYYLAGTDRYTNKYIFLEIPLSFQTRVLANTNSRLFWDLGFSLSRMLSSTALQFDQSTGIYYKDNSLLKKNQLNISTGFPVQLVNQKSFGLQLGPHMQYGMSDLFRNSISGSRHLLFVGLKAGLRLSNK